MKATTYEAIVENGQIKLPAAVHLPEHTRVLVVVPDVEAIPVSRIHSPRLGRTLPRIQARITRDWICAGRRGRRILPVSSRQVGLVRSDGSGIFGDSVLPVDLRLSQR